MIKLLQNTYHFFFKKYLRPTLFGLVILLIAYYFCLPKPLFSDPTCMVLNDRTGDLLGARIAKDGQWRFPHQADVPDKFVKAIIAFEDRHFFYHPGIDPSGIARAFIQNIRQQRIVSGGSTLTMQIIRLSRKGRTRTVFQKLLECILATRLELAFSKQEILAFYASNAPFGGNVVGLETASWRYYGKSPDLLTWAETATLAVLPNSPALIHPGRNRAALLAKRNRLLDKLFQQGTIDALTLDLSKEENLPEKPLPLPRLAPHLLDHAYKEHFKDKKDNLTRLETSIDRNLQVQATQIVAKHQQHLQGNDIHNVAALILEVETGKVAAYIGNTVGAGARHGEQVDVIPAARSTGSLLKPFLYAGLLQEGQIFPNSLISDIPTQLNAYQPKNFYETYDGVVPAKRALIRSLNIPFIRMLQDYGLEKFHFLLKQLGLSTLHQPANYYGLPLILGGAEGSLWDMTNAYACMARTLNHFSLYSGQYNQSDFRPPTFLSEQTMGNPSLVKEAPVINAAATYLTFEAMQQLERPDAEGNWEQFRSTQKIAWKTGTSIGFRDAWAIGVTPQYAIGVWVGNADGEGRPGLIGVKTAAPVLFDLFDLLPASDWFDVPYDELNLLPICKKSGYRALDICEQDSVWVPIAGQQVAACSYHQIIHLDQTGTQQVTSQCADPASMQHQSWFILPPGEAYYYQYRDPSYQALPAFKEGCVPPTNSGNHPMEMIYPTMATKIYVPIGIDGQLSRTVFKMAHRDSDATVYWHLDDRYIGSTQTFHQQALNPWPGKHILTLVDEDGFRLEQDFEIIGKE